MKMKKASIVLLAIFPLAGCLQIGGAIKPLEEGNMYHGNGAPSDSLGRDFKKLLPTFVERFCKCC